MVFGVGRYLSWLLQVMYIENLSDISLFFFRIKAFDEKASEENYFFQI